MAVAPVDEMDDVDVPDGCRRLQQLRVTVVPELVRELSQQTMQGVALSLQLPHACRVEARLARINDFLVALHHLVDVLRDGALGAEEIDLDDQRIRAFDLIENVPQRRVRYDAAVPVMFTFDDNRCERGWQRSARHDMVRANVVVPTRVE